MAGLKPINLVIKEQAVKTALRIKLHGRSRWDNNFIRDKRLTYTSQTKDIDKIINNIFVYKDFNSDWIKSTTVY